MRSIDSHFREKAAVLAKVQAHIQVDEHRIVDMKGLDAIAQTTAASYALGIILGIAITQASPRAGELLRRKIDLDFGGRSVFEADEVADWVTVILEDPSVTDDAGPSTV